MILKDDFFLKSHSGIVQGLKVVALVLGVFRLNNLSFLKPTNGLFISYGNVFQKEYGSENLDVVPIPLDTLKV